MGLGTENDDQSGSVTATIDPVAGKTVAEVLGEIVWLMTQDPAGRDMKVSDIERLVMPAILQKRFHIKYAQMPDLMRSGQTVLQPVFVSIFSAIAPMHNQEHPASSIATFWLRNGAGNAV